MEPLYQVGLLLLGAYLVYGGGMVHGVMLMEADNPDNTNNSITYFDRFWGPLLGVLLWPLIVGVLRHSASCNRGPVTSSKEKHERQDSTGCREECSHHRLGEHHHPSDVASDSCLCRRQQRNSPL